MIDDIDSKIIKLLGKDARMPNNQIAKAIKVSEGTVRNRIAKLLNQKIINISLIRNVNQMNNPGIAFIGLDVEASLKEKIAKQLSRMPEVRFVSTLMGRHDLMAFVLAENAAELSHILYQKIASIEGVRFTESSIGLKYFKYDYKWGRLVDE
ncbi:MAG: Lrp/AsnC family transcriptional regulator [Gammaproteobacteria bacterium]